MCENVLNSHSPSIRHPPEPQFLSRHAQVWDPHVTACGVLQLKWLKHLVLLLKNLRSAREKIHLRIGAEMHREPLDPFYEKSVATSPKSQLLRLAERPAI